MDTGTVTANAEMITTIITGVVSIVVAIIAFAASCKSGNHVTRQSKSDLQLEHKDLKAEMKESIGSVKHIIDVEIAKSEVRRENLTPEQIAINQVAEQIKDMHANWVESNAKINVLENEKKALSLKISSLEDENKKLRQRCREYENQNII